MAIDPNIDQYFDYKYVEGELHIYIRDDVVKELGWTDKDLELGFGGIRQMNRWGKDAHLSIHTIENRDYVHPWDEHNKKIDQNT